MSSARTSQLGTPSVPQSVITTASSASTSALCEAVAPAQSKHEDTIAIDLTSTVLRSVPSTNTCSTTTSPTVPSVEHSYTWSPPEPRRALSQEEIEEAENNSRYWKWYECTGRWINYVSHRATYCKPFVLRSPEEMEIPACEWRVVKNANSGEVYYRTATGIRR